MKPYHDKFYLPSLVGSSVRGGGLEGFLPLLELTAEEGTEGVVAGLVVPDSGRAVSFTLHSRSCKSKIQMELANSYKLNYFMIDGIKLELLHVYL